MQDVRYARQVMLKEVGEKGQKKLAHQKVMIIGAGGLGSPAALYLCAAGVGELKIVDNDTVALSNLNRQILHGTQQVGQRKVDSAASRLLSLNPETKITSVCERVDRNNIVELASGIDLIIDAVDSFGAKFVINDFCVSKRRSFVHGGVTGFTGQVMVYTPGNVCLRCLMPSMPSDQLGPAGLGIIGAAAGVIGAMQAMEAIKLLLNIGEPISNKLWSIDMLHGRSTCIDLAALSAGHRCSSCRDCAIVSNG